MAVIPLVGLKNPLPKFTPGGVSGTAVVRLSPWLHVSVPLPQYNYRNAGNLSPAGGRLFVPVVPLPGSGGGGGGGTVGYPI